MELIDAIKLRKSVRKYKDTSVDKDTISRIFTKASLAPSACNLQPWYFYIITDKTVIPKFKDVYPREWFLTAPVIIIACADINNSFTRDYDNKNYAEVDVSIIFDHITLLAVEEGLGTCWVGAFYPDKLNEVIDIKPGLIPVALTPLGYPVDNSCVVKKRKNIKEIVEFI